MGCDIIRSTPYHGQSKWIERFFRIVCERFSKQFSTYSGSNTVTRPEDSKLYDRAIAGRAKRHVMVTLDELRTAFADWEKNWYNSVLQQRGMGGRTACEVWEASGYTPRYMPPEQRERVFCRSEVKLFRRAGVHIEGLDYYNPELAAQYLGQKLLVKRPFNDLSKVFLHGLNGQFLGVAWSRAELGLEDSGITEQNLAHKKHLNKRLKKATKAYEEALGQANRKTIEDAHRRPPHEKFRAPETENKQTKSKRATNPIDYFIEEGQI